MDLERLQRVATFSVEQMFAVGPVGPVYVARDARGGQRVGLRVITSPLMSNPQHAARFEREMSSAARLRHPNLVGIVDQGVCRETGLRYVAYELVRGRGAWDLLDEKGVLSEEELIPLALGLLEGLSALEAHGLVHRHISAAGLLVGDDGQARIVDVGLGALVDADHATPYTAPEQLQRGGVVDGRADLYALGACLFLFLTGHEPPGTGHGVTGRLGQLICALCARDPERRYRDASAAKRDLLLIRGGCDPLGPLAAPPAPALQETVLEVEPVDGLAEVAPTPPAPAPASRMSMDFASRKGRSSAFYQGDGSVSERERPGAGPVTPLRPSHEPVDEVTDGDEAAWVVGARLSRDQQRMRRSYYFKHQNVGNELSQLTVDVARDLEQQDAQDADDDLPPSFPGADGRRLYMPTRRLGRGGQGVVYEAAIANDQTFPGFNQPVKVAAIKLFEKDDAMLAERAAYELAAPSLVKLLDWGQVERKGATWPFLVLERLHPLPCNRVKGARVDRATAIDVFVNLLDALHALHYRAEKPLIVNDIKPANIMLRMSNEQGQVPLDEYSRRVAAGAYEPVLLDIGCAMDREALAARGGRPEASVGSPTYWAPETCPNLEERPMRPGVYSAKSDVYALTLTFYNLLTGDVPYTVTGVHQLTGNDRLAGLVELKQGDASPVDLPLLQEVLGDDLPDFEEVLAVGLARDPDQRPSPRVMLQHCRSKFQVAETRALDLRAYRFDQTDGLRLAQKRFHRIHALFNDYTGVKDPEMGPSNRSYAPPPPAPERRQDVGLGKTATSRFARPTHVVVREESSALTDKNPQRRQRAVERIMKSGADAIVATAAPLIVALADRESVDVRSAAAKALGSVPTQQLLDPLLKALESEVPDVRAEALRLLVREPQVSQRVFDAVGKLAGDPAKRVRDRALEALGRLIVQG